MKHRLFLSITLPPAIQDSVVGVQTSLRKFDQYVTWVKPAQLHLTLNFLGRLEDADLPPLKSAISHVATSHSPFQLRLGTLSTLYKRHEQSLIYLLPQGDTQNLFELQTALSTALNELDHPQPNRYMPHVVIGTLKRTDPVSTKYVMDQLSDIEIEPLPEWSPDHFLLFESFLSKAGAHHQRLASFVLQSAVK